jgi:hypothetical protein
MRHSVLFGKRSWVKLWTNEWLDGTTRYQMSDAQRAFWIDLLALAGRSRFPGIICAGRDGDRFVGYPINRFQSLMAEPIDIEATLALFERTGKIKVEVTSKGPPKLYKIELLNWAKYQSEYQRLKKYRTPQYTRGTHQSTERVTLQRKKEVQSESQKENQKEKAHTAAEAAAVSPDGSAATAAASGAPDKRTFSAFQSLGVKPFGPARFQAIWTKRYQQIQNGEPSSFVEAMEDTIQLCQANGIPVPRKFFELKRAVEQVEVDGCFRRAPL